MISKIENLVEDACKQKTNHFGYGIWTHHITLVVKNAKNLAKILDADEEISELAALLHDYASIINIEWYPEHHIHSARLAKEILSNLNYSPVTIQRVQESIITHRGSQNLQPLTKESIVLANADAMAHFQGIDSLFYLAYVQHKKEINDGRKWILDKLERSWNKLIPEARAIVNDKYNAVKILFNNS